MNSCHCRSFVTKKQKRPRSHRWKHALLVHLCVLHQFRVFKDAWTVLTLLLRCWLLWQVLYYFLSVNLVLCYQILVMVLLIYHCCSVLLLDIVLAFLFFFFLLRVHITTIQGLWIHFYIFIYAYANLSNFLCAYIAFSYGVFYIFIYVHCLALMPK